MANKKNTRLTQMLRHRQNTCGMTEAEISAKFGFSQQAFNSWKTGVAPRPKMFPAIGAFLNASVDEVAMLADEAKVSNGTTKLPDMGAPVMARGTADSLAFDKYASGYAKPAVAGTYAARVDGRHIWVNPRARPADGNTVLVRLGDAGRIAIWPVELADGEVAHVVVLAELA
jgi:hypothetical protein